MEFPYIRILIFCCVHQSQKARQPVSPIAKNKIQARGRKTRLRASFLRVSQKRTLFPSRFCEKIYLQYFVKYGILLWYKLCGTNRFKKE